MTATYTPTVEHFAFQAEVNEVLGLVINSLYRKREIFVRELVSNASDALDKLKFRALTRADLIQEDVPLEIRVIPDHEQGTLTIEDTGIGMDREQLIRELGTVAHSGTRAFLEELKKASYNDARLIGQFGVGFYSAYLVADRVEVITRAAGDDGGAYRWTSDAKGEFTIEPAARPVHGTAVVLHLKEDQHEFLDEWRLRQLIKEYSDFVAHPIRLQVPRKDAKGQVTGTELEMVNTGKALWQRPKSEISADEYTELYKHLGHDFDEPLAHTHFNVEGAQQFTALLFIPRRRPADIFLPEQRHGVRLYVQRVFIMEDCKELLPSWLRFVRGIVDSSDLPLNISREILQDSRPAQVIRNQLTRKVLSLLEEMAAERPEDYAKFWSVFGEVLKEGLHFGVELRERLTKLARFPSSRGEELTSLADYVERMPEGQAAIYYALGDSRAAVAGSPHLEALRKRGYEVLYMVDAVDEWAVEGIGEYEGKQLVSAMKADLKLEETTEDRKEREQRLGQLKDLLDRFHEVLADRVDQVRLSDRLTDSPVCLVVPEHGMHVRTERLLRASRVDLPATKRIMELNAGHPLIENLRRLHERDARNQQVGEWIELLYDQALLTEGSPVADPNVLARRITALLGEVTAAAATAGGA